MLKSKQLLYNMATLLHYLNLSQVPEGLSDDFSYQFRLWANITDLKKFIEHRTQDESFVGAEIKFLKLFERSRMFLDTGRELNYAGFEDNKIICFYYLKGKYRYQEINHLDEKTLFVTLHRVNKDVPIDLEPPLSPST